jgi:hypothetical protein
VDLRAYYKKVREVEASLSGDFAVVVSLETTDGGKAGVTSEVAKLTAAKMVVEVRARLASEAEEEVFQQQIRDAKMAFDQAAAVNKMQFVVVPARNLPKGQKD